MTDDDLDRIMRIVMARCGDVLTENEIAEAYSNTILAGDLCENVWIEAAGRVMDALGAVEERREVLERIVNGDEDEDNADDERGGRRQASG